MQLRCASEESALHKQARCLHISCHVSDAKLCCLLRRNGPSKLVALRSVLACRIQALLRATNAAGRYVDAPAIHCQPQRQMHVTLPFFLGTCLMCTRQVSSSALCLQLADKLLRKGAVDGHKK